MRGIILAGGSGTRLHPLTKVVSKQIMPVYDKPMIYYPLSALMLSGIREVMIISTPRDLPMFSDLLGDGSNLGMSFHYSEQKNPEGLAQAFIIAKEFIGDRPTCMVLGDNLFYGTGLTGILKSAARTEEGACVFAAKVSDPERYGVVEFDSSGSVLSLEEKPDSPRSSYAVPGIYYYDKFVSQYASELKPSKRGELEISDLNNLYLKRGSLNVEIMPRGTAWLDTGTHSTLLDAGNFVQTIQRRQGVMVACIEEIAYNAGWIDRAGLLRQAGVHGKSAYGEYLQQLAMREVKSL